MDNNEIVAKLAKERMVEKIIEKITDSGRTVKDSDALPDLANDIYLSLMQDPKLPNLYNKGEYKYYITRIITNNICSNTSYFYRTYIKPLINKDPLIEKEELDE